MKFNLRSTDIRPWLTAICGITLVAGFTGEISGWLPANITLGLYIIAYLSGGYAGMVELISDLKRREINIDFLMITAAIGAAVIDQWLEGAILLFLFSLSESLESYALGRSRTAIQSLMKLRPATALLRHPDGREERVPVEALEPGQIVIVRPGEHIPIDAVVIEGETRIDQSAITGESVPAGKKRGDAVFAATLNKEGVIHLKVTRAAEDTTLAKIITLVEKAQGNKATAQRILERFEPTYALGVILFTILLITVPWLLLDHSFEPVFYRAMTVLVVASPCALIISTPAAIISAIANGARHGILFKGGAHIEQTNSIDIIAFDKTGTLTKGEPSVTDLHAFGPGNGETRQLLQIAAGCEQYSEHHLAAAILEKAQEESVEPASVNNPQIIPGKGVYGEWNGQHVSVGNRKFYEDQLPNWPDELIAHVESLEAEGKTVVITALEGEPVGLIAMADQLRPAAAETILQLRQMGIKKIVMLTGDNVSVAERMAEQLNLDEVHAGLLPDEKVLQIEKLKEQGVVAMIGDGINDAPALATSHLGVAMGAAGTDVALETADVVLMGDDLTKLPYLLRLAKKSRRIVWQNIYFSLAVILMLLAGVFLIDLPLTAGVIGHEGSTLVVVLNGLRLLSSGRNPELSTFQ